MIKWKIIIGYEDYAVSNTGEIKSLKFDRLLCGSKNGAGYKYVNLVKNKIKKSHSIHSLVMKYFGKGQTENSIIDHKDGNKSNNHIDNLQWISIKDNTEKYYNNFDKKSKLIMLYEKGIKVKDIVKMVDLSIATVYQTINQHKASKL